jgi:hypothetical protein
MLARGSTEEVARTKAILVANPSRLDRHESAEPQCQRTTCPCKCNMQLDE